ncbi:hypothetical protein MMPV_008636 [Pyropia vietnamensis]
MRAAAVGDSGDTDGGGRTDGGGDTDASGGVDSGRPPPPSPGPTDGRFRVWRLRVFVSMLLAYAVYYLCRFSFGYSAPAMRADPSLVPPLTMTAIGAITSAFPAVYGVSKLFTGVVADNFSPRLILAGGLFATAASNVAFAAGGSVGWFVPVWALNGAVNSVGFPACARLLANWFGPAERGTWWGLLNVSLNAGGFLAPLVSGGAAAAWGWRAGLLVPAAVAAAVGALVLLAVADAPAAAGFVSGTRGVPAGAPPPPARREPPSVAPPAIVAAVAGSARPGEAAAVVAALPPPSLASRIVHTLHTQLYRGVIRAPGILSLAASYFFVYIIRQSLTSWAIFYLLDTGVVSTLAAASARVSGFELGGLAGSITAGAASDALLRARPSMPAVGARVAVMLVYLAGLAAAVAAFLAVPPGLAGGAAQWLAFASVGLFLYGPQLLTGLAGAECVDDRYAGTSNGFLGCVAYGGATLAGLPVTLAVRSWGWGPFWVGLGGCVVANAAVIAPLLRLRSREQVRAAEGGEGKVVARSE